MTAAERQTRAAQNAALPYLAADVLAQLDEMTALVASSGLDGAFRACRNLHKIRRYLRRTVGRLSAQQQR